MSHRNNGLNMLSIGLAAAAGAVIALVFAPTSGKQMRRTLRRKYDGARDAIEELGDQTSDWIEKGSELAGKAKSKVAPLRKAIAG
jgi:gas vesicle protein